MIIRPADNTASLEQPHIGRRRIQLWVMLVVFAIGMGTMYGAALTAILGNAAAIGAIRGAFTGAVVGGLIGGFELFVVNGGRVQLRKLPFAQLLLIKEIAYVFFILGGDWLGGMVVHVEGAPGFGLNLVTVVTFVFSFIFALIVNFVMEVSMLLGPGVLSDFLRGYYHHPRKESRLLVFLDMRGSTAIAERIGDIAFHNLLNRFFSDLTEPVLAWNGTIHKYVGDEMIATWPLDNPQRDAAGAYSAVMAARERLARLAESYLREFGIAPDFRAILHAGNVVAGEMGLVKREIGLLGDTFNTTAKIEVTTKKLDHMVIASAEALAAATLPAGLRADPLGSFPLPGKTLPVTLHSICPA